MAEYLFIYGTLIPDNRDPEVSQVVKSLRRIGKGSVRGKLYDLGDYPGAILDSSATTSIQGEIVELPENLLDELDNYEEYDPSNPQKSLFVRTKARIRRPNGSVVEAWIYVYNGALKNARLIPGGNYSKIKVA